MDTRSIDRKGILAYLLITFGFTYAIELALILPGFRADGVPQFLGQLVIAGVMWVPTLAALLTLKLVTHEPLRCLNLRFGRLRPYLTAMLAVPAAYALIYGLTWLLSLGQPDWQMAYFRSIFTVAGAEVPAMPAPNILWPILFLLSSLAAPFINSLFGLGEEIGWRGFLLPRLLPLGKRRAYGLLGIIWGLWHAPLILVGFNYPGEPILGIVWMVGLTTALGVYINELTLRERSTILAGWLHGLFNSQAYGIWRVLFPAVNPLIGGVTGLIGMAVWLALGLWEVGRSGATSQRPAAAASAAH
ncbi:MAG TPA: CPBP family intramembrane glutamic endopeptidase [Roseiflexaceae bacterium]|nr:CPBP family intramembrane glutamic endopeptidase [Roseiflexaceae bacterium]